MNDRQFLKRLISLTNKLCDSVNKYGFGSDVYKAILDEIHEEGARFDRIYKRKQWLIRFLIIVLIILSTWLFYSILRYLQI